MPVHPLLVHLPIAFALFGPVFFLVLLLVIRRRPESRGLWKWTILWQFLMCASIYAAMATGDGDAKEVRAHIGSEAIGRHEDAAELLFFMALLALVPALAGVKASAYEFAARITATVMQVALLAFCVNTARLGGEIVYKHGGAKAHVKQIKKETQSPPDKPNKNSLPARTAPLSQPATP